MRNSTIDKRKNTVSVKINGRHRTEDFSDVSEEGSLTHTEEKDESVDEQIGWGYFHQARLQIQSLVNELMPKYKEYRNVLFESIKEICQEGKITKYDYSRLALDPEPEATEPVIKTEAVALEDKISLIEKIISERRIKKYYKNKHQINFQDELDPENDEREIYKIYQEAFAKKEENNPKSIKVIDSPNQILYNDQFLTVPQPNAIPSNKIETANKMLDLSNQYNIDIDESFQRMKEQGNEVGGGKIVNYTRLKDPSVGFEHELSFDIKNQQYFQNTNNKNIDSFGFIDDRDEINSQIRYDADKMKKFLKTNKSIQKSSDQLSHGDQIFKNYVEKHYEELNKQKQRVNELTEKAQKVLNNDIDIEDHKNGANGQEDKISQLRYLLGEIIEVFSVEECLKYNLKFKSYELLNKLYQNASRYFGEVIIFEQPLEVKYMSQIIQAAMPEEKSDGIQVVVRNIFGNFEQISYQQFLERLTPSINDKEYDIIESGSYTVTSTKSLDMTIRLFNIWIQIDYFEKQLKLLLQKNQEIVDKFIDETKENQMLMPQLIAEFVTKSKKIPKNKKMKTEVFFRKILGNRLIVSEFYRWIDSKTDKNIDKIVIKHEEDAVDYDYHLY